jgi:hypothetical protein
VPRRRGDLCRGALAVEPNGSRFRNNFFNNNFFDDRFRFGLGCGRRAFGADARHQLLVDFVTDLSVYVELNELSFERREIVAWSRAWFGARYGRRFNDEPALLRRRWFLVESEDPTDHHGDAHPDQMADDHHTGQKKKQRE